MDPIDLVAVSMYEARQDALSSYITALNAAPYVGVKLFKNNVAITPLSQLGQFTEADYLGYVPPHITSWNGPYLTPGGVAWALSGMQIFTGPVSGPANTIYSAGLVRSTGAAATATGAETGGVVDDITVTGGGSGYLIPPKVTITDATIGTGARAHAVLTDGVVTSIVIDDGGSGYTGPIVTIEPPVRLIAGKNLPNPVQLITPDDAFALTMELQWGV